MIYFIYGNQSPTIKSQTKKIVSTFLNNQVDDFNYIKIDGHNVLVQDMVDECRYVSLGYDKKAVSFENAYFLLKSKPRNKLEQDQDYNTLKRYIEEDNNSDEALLVISVVSDEIDEKNEIVKLLKEKAKVVEIADPDEKTFLEYVKSYCVKYNIHIDRDALSELAYRTDGDVALFKNSITKLTLYTDHITYFDVVKMVSRKLEDNAFLISTLLVEGKNMQALQLFRDLKVTNIQPVTLISQLANQFRLLSQVRYLLKRKRLAVEEVAKELKIKPGRVYVLNKQLPLISEKKIYDTIEDLYKLDLDIKSGQVDHLYAFELFLIKFERN